MERESARRFVSVKFDPVGRVRQFLLTDVSFEPPLTPGDAVVVQRGDRRAYATVTRAVGQMAARTAPPAASTKSDEYRHESGHVGVEIQLIRPITALGIAFKCLVLALCLPNDLQTCTARKRPSGAFQRCRFGGHWAPTARARGRGSLEA